MDDEGATQTVLPDMEAKSTSGLLLTQRKERLFNYDSL